MRILVRLADFLQRLNRFFSAIADWLCLLLVLLTVQQVLARYLFDSSSIALQELEWHIFGIIFLFSSAHALGKDEHVRVDLLYSQFSSRGRALVDFLGLLFFVLPAALLIFFYSLNFIEAALSFTNPHPADYYSRSWFDPGGFTYRIFQPVEAFLRNWILVGEISPDPGGLEARWLIKAAIPFACLLLTLESLALLLQKGMILFGISEETRTSHH